MKKIIIALISMTSFLLTQAQVLLPFEDGSQLTISLEEKKDFRLPVSSLRKDGGMLSSVKIKSFKEVQIFNTTKSQTKSSILAHQYYMKEMKKKGFIEIFRCKDECKGILKLIVANLLPNGHLEYQKLENSKRYSYAIFHKNNSVAIIITNHSNENNVKTFVAVSTLK